MNLQNDGEKEGNDPEKQAIEVIIKNKAPTQIGVFEALVLVKFSSDSLPNFP